MSCSILFVCSLTYVPYGYDLVVLDVATKEGTPPVPYVATKIRNNQRTIAPYRSFMRKTIDVFEKK